MKQVIDKNEVVRRFKEGERVYVIAQSLNVTKQRISQIVRYNVPLDIINKFKEQRKRVAKIKKDLSHKRQYKFRYNNDTVFRAKVRAKALEYYHKHKDNQPT